jgi:hypothetical protein
MTNCIGMTSILANGLPASADEVTIHSFGHIETSGLGAAGLTDQFYTDRSLSACYFKV